MTTKMRTLDDVANERQALLAELTGMEAQLKRLSEKIGDINIRLTHNYIQEARLKQAAGLIA